jgi:hypothetical protein
VAQELQPPSSTVGVKLAATRPADISEARWQLFLDDVGRLLDGGWTPKLVEVGGTTVDVLGVYRLRPSVRVDAMGAGWFIKGGKGAAVYRRREADG